MLQPLKFIAVAGVTALALLGVSLGTPPANAATPLTSVAVTDGTTESYGNTQVSYESGSSVTMVLNDASQGDFTFTGCWVVYNDDSGVLLASNSAGESFTWTAGSSVDSILPAVDLTPDASTNYEIMVYDVEQGIDCNMAEEEATIAWIRMGVVVPVDEGGTPQTERISMTLTGDARIGSTVSVQSKVPGSLVGDDFDLWACPSQEILPRDDQDPTLNGECVGPFIQSRTGDSTTFLLGYDPVRDATNPDAQQFWDSICGKFFVVNDYPGGGHSNWLGPIDCSAAAPTATSAAALAKTGSTGTLVGLSIGALLLIAGSAVLLTRRSQRASRRS